MDLSPIPKFADIGCGAGILSESMYIHGATVHAIDLNEKLIEAGKARALSNKLNIVTKFAHQKHLQLSDQTNLI